MLRISLIDLHGRLRSKYIAASLDRTTFCSTVLLHDIAGRTVAVPGFGGDVGHVNLVALRAGAARPTGTSTVHLTHLQLLDGREHPLCLRSALRTNATRLKSLGWRMRVGVELEFFLREPGDIEQAGPEIEHDLYGEIDQLSAIGRAAADILRIGTRADVRLGSLAREYERSQFEITTLPRPLLEAADDVLVIKQIVKEVPTLHGLRADLSPQPSDTGLGSGMHINVSLVEVAGGNPWTFTVAEQFGRWLSTRILDWVAVFVPSPSGYARLRNRQLATAATFGVDRRDTLVRLADGDTAPRLEIRLPDPHCNIHLALCVIAALTQLWMKNREQIDSVTCSDYPVASSLSDAVDLAMAWGEPAIQLVGREIVDAFRAIKTSELEFDGMTCGAVDGLYSR